MDNSSVSKDFSADQSAERKRLFASGNRRENFRTLCGLALKVLYANFLFLLFSLPIITIPASKIALTQVMLKIYRLSPCPVWQVFWGEFRRKLPAKTGIGIVLLLAPVSAYIYIYSSSNSISTIVFFVLYTVIAYLIECYWMTAVCIVDVPVWANLKNAVLLTMTCWKRSFMLLVSAGLVTVLVIFLLPYTLILFFYCFALIQLMIGAIASVPVQKNLLKDAL